MTQNITPDYKIEADGKDITAVLKERKASISIKDESGIESDSLDMVLVRQGMKLPATGAELKVWIGYKESGLVYRGLYTVKSLKIKKVVVAISAKAINFSKVSKSKKNSIKSQKTHSWNKHTLGEIIATIAAEHNYPASISEKYKNTLIEHIDQTDETDLNFLTRLAHDNGAIFKSVDGRLLFLEESAAVSNSGKELTRIDLLLSDIQPAWEVEIEDREIYNSVEIRWHDTNKGEEVSAVVGGGEPVRRMPRVFPNSGDAVRAGAAEMLRLSRGNQKVSITVQGDPLIFAESPLFLDFQDSLISSNWIVKSCTHPISSSGYKTTMQLESK